MRHRCCKCLTHSLVVPQYRQHNTCQPDRKHKNYQNQCRLNSTRQHMMCIFWDMSMPQQDTKTGSGFAYLCYRLNQMYMFHLDMMVCCMPLYMILYNWLRHLCYWPVKRIRNYMPYMNCRRRNHSNNNRNYTMYILYTLDNRMRQMHCRQKSSRTKIPKYPGNCAFFPCLPLFCISC